MQISAVVLDKIKKAAGKVQITEGISPMMWNLQVMENGAWITVLSNQPRGICEAAVKRGGQNIILG